MSYLLDSLPPIPFLVAMEWINVCIEFTVVSWVRLPRLFWMVLAVNLATHPALMLFLPRLGNSFLCILAAEVAIWLVEGTILAVTYRRNAKVPFLFFIAFLMNAASYGTGLLLDA